MGKVQRRKRHHVCNKTQGKAKKTKRKTQDIDQIYDAIKAGTAGPKEIDVDLPGFGQHLCVQCNRHFMDEDALKTHFTSKGHKRRLKELKDEPYRGSDIPVDNGLRKTSIIPPGRQQTSNTTTV
eukprot:TRINITY_DN1608_c0_g1_i1.p1 TRINITY_DN1608_c0_g1~~TRINITY_DN1608_c0_g1_i1.p1  ORF type:complete len:131 (-),score=34.09 TRINITY_DN1608_c0_g1_i1:164-535(-)